MGNLSNQNISYYSQYSFEDQVSMNVIDFLRYGLLELGSYYNIRRGQTDYLGNDASKLRPVGIPGVTNFTRYGGLKHDWVWESGVVTNGPEAPISISGIYVDGSFYANNSYVKGTGWYTDYTNGHIVFTHPVPTSIIQVEHTIRHLTVYSADSPIFTKLIKYYADRNNWDLQGSGIDNTNYEAKRFLPAIFVNIINYTSQGMEIGSRSKWAYPKLQFDIFALNPSDRKKASDICYLLEDKSFIIYKVNEAQKPLTYLGTIASGAKTQPQLISAHYGGVAKFNMDASLTKTNLNIAPLQHSTVRIGLEIPVYL